MPIIVACPSCGGKLRIADALRGRRVRCPACNRTFDSEPAASAAEAGSHPAANPAGSLDLTIDDPASPPLAAPSNGPRGPIGAVELKRSWDEPSAPPRPPAPLPSEPLRRDDDDPFDSDVPDIRRRMPRRDAEPNRGALVLTLGILSLVTVMVYCLAPIGAILGVIAWILGQKDLRKMKSGLMDEQGRGTTQAGWICGILGTVLNGLMTLGCGLGIGFIWYTEMSRPPNTRPIIVTPPPNRVPPNNPPGRKW